MFSGGLVLAVFTMSLWPVMTDKLQSCPPGRTMAVAVLTWCLEILYAIWTVAYNFVPGGVYTREHTDHLIFAVMISIGIGYLSGKLRTHFEKVYACLKFNLYFQADQINMSSIFLIPMCHNH